MRACLLALVAGCSSAVGSPLTVSGGGGGSSTNTALGLWSPFVAQDPLATETDYFDDSSLDAKWSEWDQPGAISVIAWDSGQAIGLINAFVGFSTFKAKPLLNIHDIIVRPAWRQRGVCSAMLEHIQTLAQRRGYCKLTLEVLEGNTAARHSYQHFGFVDYQLRPGLATSRNALKLLEIVGLGEDDESL